MKRILVIATGGTIASAQGKAGLSPALTGEELLGYVPEAADLCELGFVQPMNIDSTNMTPDGWLAMRDIIRDAYEAWDGFVILHGTDTLAYTAAALSYLIQGSPKPIVVTGSQQPMSSPFTDARLNVYQSLLWAVDDASSEVSVVFGGEVIRGPRARTQRTMSHTAFVSVNVPPLAYIRGERIMRGAPAPAELPAGPVFYDGLDRRVLVIKLTPALDPRKLMELATSTDAVVLETFGIGGIPERDDYTRVLEEWVASGRFAVITTQVPEEGVDLGIYEVGKRWQDHPGILLGADMTTEAVLAKTMWALGQTRDADEVAELFRRPVNGDRIEL